MHQYFLTAMLAALALSTTLPSAVCAESPESEAAAEARQYQSEEAADFEKNGDKELAYASHQGLLKLYSQAQSDASGDTTILGTFESGEATYLVKTTGEEVKKALEKLDGKRCSLKAKIRNNGKFIIVKSIVLAGPGDAGARRRGGL